MLGTSGLKDRFSVTALDIAQSAGRLARLVMGSDCGVQGRVPDVVLMAPPPLADVADLPTWTRHGLAISQDFARCYAEVAAELGCPCVDVGQIVGSNPIDGAHISVQQTSASWGRRWRISVASCKRRSAARCASRTCPCASNARACSISC
ncbi:MAG: hypothetical protein R3E95_01540 [Thiolinea sp.]